LAQVVTLAAVMYATAIIISQSIETDSALNLSNDESAFMGSAIEEALSVFGLILCRLKPSRVKPFNLWN
jgi:hypothetical protein